MKPKDGNGPARSYGRGYLYVGVGFQFVGAILLFLYLGWKADGWLGISPVLTILGAFLGGALGFYAIVREVQRDVERSKSEGKQS